MAAGVGGTRSQRTLCLLAGLWLLGGTDPCLSPSARQNGLLDAGNECNPLAALLMPFGLWTLPAYKLVLTVIQLSQVGGYFQGTGPDGTSSRAHPSSALLDAFTDLEDHPDAPAERLHDAVERLVRLYEAWGKLDVAAEWRVQLSPADETTVDRQDH